MDKAHLLSYCAFIVASFVWIQWQRTSGRVSRVLGVVGIFGLSWMLMKAIQYVAPN